MRLRTIFQVLAAIFLTACGPIVISPITPTSPRRDRAKDGNKRAIIRETDLEVK